MSYETDDKMVSHPDHYKSGKYEVIDIIDEFTKGLEGTEAVCTANAIKYILRWKKKNGIQDVKKAIWYLQHLVDKEEEKDSKPSAIVIHRMANGLYGIENVPDGKKKEPKPKEYDGPDEHCRTCTFRFETPENDEICKNCFGREKYVPDEINKEDSSLSVETHTNAAGVTVPDSEPWSSSKEPHISLPNVCPICKFELRKPNLEPCKSCKMYSNWKPKEKETNEQSSET